MFKSKKIFFLVLVIFIAIFLTGCNGDGEINDRVYNTLQGTIKDINGNAINDVEVSIGDKTSRTNHQGVWQIKD